MSFSPRIIDEDPAPLRADGELAIDLELERLAARLGDDAVRLMHADQGERQVLAAPELDGLPRPTLGGESAGKAPGEAPGKAVDQAARKAWGWLLVGALAGVMASSVWMSGSRVRGPSIRATPAEQSSASAPRPTATLLEYHGEDFEPPAWIHLSEPELEGFLDLQTRPGLATISI